MLPILALLLAQSGTFTRIDYPGAFYTAALGINDAGDVVGFYQKDDYVVHGFLFRGGEFTSIDVPGATFTEAVRIDNAGDILVDSQDSEYAAHSYILSGGVFSELGLLFPRDFNGGSIVGIEYSYGYLYKDGIKTLIEYPGADVTGAMGIDSGGDIVGYGATIDPQTGTLLSSHGFLLHAGTFTDIDLPGAITFGATAINGGTIIGTAQSEDLTTHGFVFRDGTYTVLDAPNTHDTFASGINGKGQIAGSYFPDFGGNQAGYVFTPAPPACSGAPTVTATPVSLWPPDGRYVEVTLSQCAAAVDPCTGPLDLATAGTISSVSSSEGTGIGLLTGSQTGVMLQVARSGTGSGRTYSISFEVTNAAGNQTTAVCSVQVAHDQRASRN